MLKIYPVSSGYKHTFLFMNKFLSLFAAFLVLCVGADAQQIAIKRIVPIQKQIATNWHDENSVTNTQNCLNPVPGQGYVIAAGEELPATNCSYSRSINSLYFGLNNTNGALPNTVIVGPVLSPVKYTNTSTDKNASFTWSYIDDNVSGEVLTSNDKDLSITYKTDYTSEKTARNNWYKFPTLSGVSETTAPGQFTYDGFFQAGGKAEYSNDDAEVMQFGLSIVNPTTEGLATYATSDNMPLFGYNDKSDEYWSYYSFEELADENNWSHLIRYANFFYAPDQPLVIEGIHTNAYGKINRNVNMFAEIYLLSAGFVIPEEPYATATCSADDITITELEGEENDLLSFSFKFDKPIVFTKALAPYIVVAIGGFHDSENVEYFMPAMSAVSSPTRMGLGWVAKQLCMDGSILPTSWSSTTNFVPDEALVSFYIMLDAAFPWLEGKDDVITITGGQSVDVSLGSYYDGSDLSFEGLPEWLSATAKGRYANTVVTFTATHDAPDIDGVTVTVTAPGVSKEIKLSAKSSGIESILATPAVNDGIIYDLNGRQISDDNLEPGVYVVRHADGSAFKFIKR